MTEIFAMSSKRMQNDAQQGDSEPGGNDDDAAVNAEFIGTALEHMQLDECTDWEHLTPEQQAAFIKAVDDGKLADLVEPWQPWWTVAGAVLESKDRECSGPSSTGGRKNAASVGEDDVRQKPGSDEDFLSQMFSACGQEGTGAGDSSKEVGARGKQVVIEEDEEDVRDQGAGDAGVEEGGSDAVSRVPPVPKHIPPLSSLTSKGPSPLLSFSLAGILWCYALSQRRCNGETHGDAHMASEAARLLLIAGGDLLLPPADSPPPPPPSSVLGAIQQCTECSAKEQGPLPLPLLLELAEDVETLMGTKARVLAALSDSRDILLTG